MASLKFNWAEIMDNDNNEYYWWLAQRDSRLEIADFKKLSTSSYYRPDNDIVYLSWT